jgi:hypothetical protein
VRPRAATAAVLMAVRRVWEDMRATFEKNPEHSTTKVRRVTGHQGHAEAWKPSPAASTLAPDVGFGDWNWTCEGHHP